MSTEPAFTTKDTKDTKRGTEGTVEQKDAKGAKGEEGEGNFTTKDTKRGTEGTVEQKDAKGAKGGTEGEMKKGTLFCWSGGGLAGLDIHLGMLCALDAAGIRADANAGTSAGAIMAAFDSAGVPLQELGNLLHRLTDADVREERLLWKLRFMHLDGMLAWAPIYTLLDKHLPQRFEDLQKPCSVFATNERTCQAECITSGGLVSAVMASMAIAGVFSPVKRDGATLSDGGTTAYLPLPPDWADYERVYMMVARRPLRYQGRGIIGRLLWNIDLMLEDQLADTFAAVKARRPDAVVLRPPVTPTFGSMRFDHSLTHEAAHYTRMVLEVLP